MSSDKRSSAASYNFQHSKGAQKIWLKIQTLLSSTSYKVQASLDLTVKQLTMEISRVLKMDKGNKCLIYGDKVLPEEETLMNLNLPNNALLYLVPEMKTGPINYSVKIIFRFFFCYFLSLNLSWYFTGEHRSAAEIHASNPQRNFSNVTKSWCRERKECEKREHIRINVH